MRDDLIGRETPIHMTKYDGSYHRRWPARFVARKGPLYLLTCAPGDLVYERGVPEDGTGGWPLRWAGDIFAWEDRWYNVGRNRRDGETWYYVNVATPVQFDGAQFHCIDLDLDISWFVGDEPRVLDEEEFLAHSEAMRYPADVIERARAAVDEVLGLIGERAFPFDRT
jgi:hypothetical protein